MATVLEVVDTRSGERRALKLMLPSGKGEEIARRFRGEFRALSRLSHKNVLKVYEGGTFEDRPYFAMELLEGTELREAVVGWRDLPPSERFALAESVLVQIARALEYVHTRGIVHRDVTPANIFLLPDGTARLMDFGVVKEAGGDVTMLGEVVGTVAYMAPEQIGGGRVDARADLYSLGAVLYLMLTGRRPFNARTLAGYVEKHLNRPVRPPSELAPTLSRKLDDICVRLLAKDPSDRFASATHLLHVLEADAPALPALDSGGADWRTALVGRAGEVALVREAVARLAAGRGGVLVIEGASGLGKTRLAEEAVDQARRFGVAVHTARNTSPDQQAFAGFRPLYEDLQELRGGLPHPVLERAFGGEPAVGAPLERPAVGAALKDLVPTDQPRLIFLDDIDQADRGTIELLGALIRALLGLANAPVLFVLTLRELHLQPDLPLYGILDGTETGVFVQRIALGPLSVAAVEAMLLGLVVDDPRARLLARRLHSEGEGNPYLIAEMLRGLIEQRALVLGENGARGAIVLDEATLQRSTLPIPATLREAILERLHALPPDALRIAFALAVARQEVRIDLLISATNLDEDQVQAALDVLLEAGLVRERRVAHAERYELPHSRLQDVLREETSDGDRVLFHRRIGDALERLNRRQISQVVEDLAYHFEQGNAPAKAYPYLVQAAEKLLSRGFMAEALATLDRALVAEHASREFMTLDDADRRLSRTLLRRASALFHLGQWADGNNEAMRADDLAQQIGDPALQAGTAAELGQQALKRNDLPEAENQLRRALQEANLSGNRALLTQPLYDFGGLLWARGDLEGARKYWLEVLINAKECADERSLAAGYNGLGLLALCKGQVTEARDHLERAHDLCERLGLIERLVVSTTNLVELCHLTGHFRKGLALADRAVAQSREMNYRFGVSLGLFYRAFILTDLGRWAEAEEHARTALETHRGLGSADDEVATLLLLARIALERHEMDRALGWLDRALELAGRVDTEGFVPLTHAWRAIALASAERQAEAREALVFAARPGRPWPYQRTRLLLSLSRAWRMLGEQEQALAAAHAALEIAESCGFRYYVLLARVFCMRAGSPEEAATQERLARALANSLAAGLEREDTARFLLQLGLAPPTPPWAGIELDENPEFPVEAGIEISEIDTLPTVPPRTREPTAR